MKELVLGTANFGSNYGHFDSHKIDEIEIERMLAWASGKITELDTALDYPGSHQSIAMKAQDFKITTKLNLKKVTDEEDLLRAIRDIRASLKTCTIQRLLVRPSNEKTELVEGCLSILNELHEEGVIESIGASIYEISELKQLQEMNMRIDVLQVPANLANREFDDLVKSGNLELNQYKTYVRSIFLQGILLKSIDDLPRKMSGLHKLILTINDEAKKLGAKPVEVCMAYAKQIQWATGIIIGARNLVDLQDLYNTFCDNLTLSERFLETLPRVVNSLYDPRYW